MRSPRTVGEKTPLVPPKSDEWGTPDPASPSNVVLHTGNQAAELIRHLRRLGCAPCHHEPAKAVQELQIAESEELWQTGLSFFAFFGNMYPAYVRGQAFLDAGEKKEAAAEFRKFADHPGIVIADPVGVMAKKELEKLSTQK